MDIHIVIENEVTDMNQHAYTSYKSTYLNPKFYNVAISIRLNITTKDKNA